MQLRTERRFTIFAPDTAQIVEILDVSAPNTIVPKLQISFLGRPQFKKVRLRKDHL